MEQENRTVTISLAEYYDLIDDSVKLRLLVSACFANSSLNYDGSELLFRDADICLALQVVDPARYRGTVSILKAEKLMGAEDDQA